MKKREMQKTYDPKDVEKRIYEFWMEGRYFTPNIDKRKDPFVVIMPPPNVTGELHMGHALTTALEDLMVRWHRMKGDPTLYLPGTDHAGIATQVVVERSLSRDNITRHQLGRKEFVEQVWNWVGQYGDRIYEQLKRLGASCDWSKRNFTLDEGPSRAVRRTFVNLYERGLIYRDEGIGHWCPRCATALSDLEVRHEEKESLLYQIKYQIEDGSSELIVATTRPESLLGDVAVAVHPGDDRYRPYIGKNVVLPILKRLIPVVADDVVDMEFGTGVLKVTPGHDYVDFEIGKRHGLPIISILDLDGKLNENAGPYEGVKMIEARKLVVDQIKQNGLLANVVPYKNSIGHCDRCGAVVEPLVSKQWYMSVNSLAQPAIQAVKDGRINIIPERFAKIYFNWMENIRDWCISRQLWWGHRIPVWYCDDCNQIMVNDQDPSECSRCRSSNLEQDPDVLDTWFSSALWPHSTLGWPDQTEELDYFYPSTVLETGHDILFFWVARMIMTGLENMGDIPFRTVYLHGLVRDPKGVKMSKSKGNVMDPIDLIESYGADALRFALTTGNSPGNDMRLNESKMEASRNFANKLWNAARFVMTNMEGHNEVKTWPPEPTHIEDRWVMSRLNATVNDVDRFMTAYQFGEAQKIIHDFFWNEYCDWYIEMSKVRLRLGRVGESPIPTLAFVMDKVLRLLHPFMPSITEEIWQILVGYLPKESGRPEALIIAPYPEPSDSLSFTEAENAIGFVVEIIRAVRNLRAELHVPSNQRIDIRIDAPKAGDVVEMETPIIKMLAQINQIEVNIPTSKYVSSDEVSLVLSGGTVAVPLGSFVDLPSEKTRLSEELEEIDIARARLSKRLDDENFLVKAPDEVVEKERQRLAGANDRRGRIVEILSRFR